MKSTTSFLDSNVIVYAFTNSDFTDTCRRMVKKRNLLTNTLVLVESYSKIKTINDEEQAKQALRSLFRLNNLRIVDLDSNLLFKALKSQSALRIGDLVHYMTALSYDCSSIVSYDKHFKNLNIKWEKPGS